MVANPGPVLVPKRWKITTTGRTNGKTPPIVVEAEVTATTAKDAQRFLITALLGGKRVIEDLGPVTGAKTSKGGQTTEAKSGGGAGSGSSRTFAGVLGLSK